MYRKLTYRVIIIIYLFAIRKVCKHKLYFVPSFHLGKIYLSKDLSEIPFLLRQHSNDSLAHLKLKFASKANPAPKVRVLSNIKEASNSADMKKV